MSKACCFIVLAALLGLGAAYVIRTADGYYDVQKIDNEDGTTGVAFAHMSEMQELVFIDEEGNELASASLEEEFEMSLGAETEDDVELEAPAVIPGPAYFANAILLV